jgi:putative ATP-binding cassette transporter
MVRQPPLTVAPRALLVQRFWTLARGFWAGDRNRLAWMLTIALVALVFLQLAVQYRLNLWNRDIFNALERRDGASVVQQALIFLPLATATVGLAITAVYGRMTMQREWRAWLADQLIGRWLRGGHYYQLNLIAGDHQNPEGRITDDARIATDAPVDFAVGILGALATAATFVGVLWSVGGSITLGAADGAVVVPGYLVVSAVLYSAIVSSAMVLAARRFVPVSERTMQAEAEMRYALTRLRDNGESIALLGGEREEHAALRRNLGAIVQRWTALCRQHMRSTLVSNGNYVLAPVVPLVLCAPKYLEGTMSLGEVVQAAAAFVHVQSAFNWMVDNYPRLADWMASSGRVGSLLVALDHLDAVGHDGATHAIRRTEADGPALRLRDLSVTLDDGTVVIDDADAVIQPGEKVMVVGESGTGKSTLVRAIAGLWPWGEGEIAIHRNARLFLMPQHPYIPIGSLRRAAAYPRAADTVPDPVLRELMQAVGLDHLTDRLDEEGPWNFALSGGETQRLAFVRLLLHRPDIVVMDEATSALDPASQARLMALLVERLPDIALVTVAHRPELEAFHRRKLVFEHRPGGARLVKDGAMLPGPPAVPQRSGWWPLRRAAAS